MEIVAELQAEIERLKLELNEEKKRRLQLEEECDLLATYNEKLASDLEMKNKSINSTGEANGSTATIDGCLEDVFLVESGVDLSQITNFISQQIANACEGHNVVSVGILSSQGSDDAIILAGGANNRVYAYNMKTSSQILRKDLSAPPLGIEVFDNFIAISGMDGSMTVVNLFPYFILFFSCNEPLIFIQIFLSLRHSFIL